MRTRILKAVVSGVCPTHLKLILRWLQQYMNVLEKLLEANKTGWFVGGKVTIADLRTHQVVAWLKSGILDGLPTTLLDAYPLLCANHDKVEALPQIVAWRAKHGTKYDTFKFVPEN
jgi:glutathione S-transferase